MPISGKKLGLRVGDFVHTGAFPAVIISDVGTYAPCCEVFGLEQELGSVYAHDLKPITKEQFITLAEDFGHGQPFRVWSDRTLASMRAAGFQVEKR